MITLDRAHLRAIADAAEAAYPLECCGLLVGRRAGTGTRVTAVHPSPNVADAPERAFEIDPQILIDMHRHLRGSDQAIVGHYHSHPDHPARPSARDLARAWEPEMIWVIVAVEGGQAIHTTAHRLMDSGGGFAHIPLVTADWNLSGDFQS